MHPGLVITGSGRGGATPAALAHAQHRVIDAGRSEFLRGAPARSIERKMPLTVADPSLSAARHMGQP